MENKSKPILRNPKFVDGGRVIAQIFNDPRFPDGEWVTTSHCKSLVTRNTDYDLEFTQ